MVHLTPQEKKTFLFVSLVFALGAGVMVYRNGTGGQVCSLDINAPAHEPAPVFLNRADRVSLIALPGIGEKLAEEIILERQRRGGFKNIEELKSVRGITDATLEGLKGLVRVE